MSCFQLEGKRLIQYDSVPTSFASCVVAQVFSIPDGGDACLLLAQLGYVAQPAATASASSASAAAAAADPALRCMAVPRDQYSRNAAHKHDIDHAVAVLATCRAELLAWLRGAATGSEKEKNKERETEKESEMQEQRAAACVKQLCAALATMDAVRGNARIEWHMGNGCFMFLPCSHLC